MTGVGRDSTLELTQRIHTTGHNRPVSVAPQFSMKRTFAVGRREAFDEYHVVPDSLIA